MTAYTARALSTDKLQHVIVQTAHGFSVGEIVINDALVGPPNYIPAIANMISSCFACMMVSYIIDANTFVVTQTGYVPNITTQTFTAGASYYLSATNSPPNQLVVNAPSSVGNVVLPLFKADSPTSGFFFGGTGTVIESSALFAWNTNTSGPVAMSVNNGYLASSGTPITYTLPTNGAIGDIVRLANIEGGFTIHYTTNQFIDYGNEGTTISTGHLDSSAVSDAVELLCFEVSGGVSVGWLVLSSIGNLVVA